MYSRKNCKEIWLKWVKFIYNSRISHRDLKLIDSFPPCSCYCVGETKLSGMLNVPWKKQRDCSHLTNIFLCYMLENWHRRKTNFILHTAYSLNWHTNVKLLVHHINKFVSFQSLLLQYQLNKPKCKVKTAEILFCILKTYELWWIWNTFY